MSKEIDQIVETLSSLTIKDALSLVKTLEETWGVSAAAAAAPAAAGAPGVAAADLEYEVIITSVDSTAKIALVRHIKDILGLTLMDAKKFVDGLPKAVKSGLSEEEANTAKQGLEKIGAQVELKAL